MNTLKPLNFSDNGQTMKHHIEFNYSNIEFEAVDKEIMSVETAKLVRANVQAGVEGGDEGEGPEDAPVNPPV